MADWTRIRARPAGLASPVTGRPMFRIEDGTGRLLRRIGSAGSPIEAIMHYWRRLGGDATFAPTMTEPPFDARLRRRIEAARAARGDVGHGAMRTRELPLPEPERQPEPPTRPERAKRRPREDHQDPDLFGTTPPAASEPEPEPELQPVAAPEPEAQPDATPDPPVSPPPKGPYPLNPDLVLLQRVDARNLRPNDQADSYLYHVTNGLDARAALRNGLMVSAQDPVILTERQGVAYWLSALAEDLDVIMDGPADFVVLRLRRIAVEALLEPDPDASRSAGCACYLLTGGPAVRR